MTYQEVHGDLFTAPQGYYLAHCISGDFTLGAGIAKRFDEVYNMRFKLFRDYPFDDGEKYGWVGSALLIDNVFNLVTKPRRFHMPDYDTLYETLIDMRDQCESMSITKLAMPKIGSGLDKLDWEQVKELIQEAFDGSDIEIVVYVVRDGYARV